MTNPYAVVVEFEQAVADFAGAPSAVAVDSCTNALMLALRYCFLHHLGPLDRYVTVPAKTYCSVPMAVMAAGGRVRFAEVEWHGAYRLAPWPVIDGAKRFRRGMFESGFHCLSFHRRKLLPIGRGGMVLHNFGPEADRWLRRARYNGRDPDDSKVAQIVGYDCYMEPHQAARGLELLAAMPHGGYVDQEEDYPDLRAMPAFNGVPTI